MTMHEAVTTVAIYYKDNVQVHMMIVFDNRDY